MKTIIIQIQVPDGVNVQVNQGGQQQPRGGGNGGGRPFVEQPDPPRPQGYCSECGQDNWRKIAAGFSKTKTNPDGSPKRFNAFYVCDTEDCEGKPQNAVMGDELVTIQEDALPF